MRRYQLQEIHDCLEHVTGQGFKLKVHENTDTSLLCSWRNETRVGYVLSIEMQDYQTACLSLGVEKYKQIETRFCRNLHTSQCQRLFADPLKLLRIWVGQETGNFL